MADDLGDARSRGESRRLRAVTGGARSGGPVFAIAPRRVPQGHWWISPGDLLGFGVGLILMAFGMRCLGVIGG